MTALFFFWQIWHYTYWRQRIDPHAALNALIFIPFFDFRHFHNPVHTCGWSLSFEFWFYILFALLLAVFGSRALLAVIFALAIPCALVSLFYTGAWFTPKFLFSPFTLEFAAGALLYQLRKYSSVWTLAFAAAGVLVFGAATLKTQAMGFHPAMLAHPLLAFRRALLWGGLGVSSVALTVSLDQWKSLHWPRGLVFLGDCSYSIYLIQPFAVSAALFFGVRHVYGGPYTQGAIYVTFAAIGGVLLSKWIEMPMTRWVKGRLVPAR
jgi:peptidoglycan/LPS O-acetylase OafA/YrhL